eukprot:RCo007702
MDESFFLRREQGRTPAAKSREAGFDVRGNFGVRVPEYNGLRDSHLKVFFQNRVVRRALEVNHQIDRTGRILDLSAHKSKLRIIDQEFRAALQAENDQRYSQAASRSPTASRAPTSTLPPLLRSPALSTLTASSLTGGAGASSTVQPYHPSPTSSSIAQPSPAFSATAPAPETTKRRVRF